MKTQREILIIPIPEVRASWLTTNHNKKVLLKDINGFQRSLNFSASSKSYRKILRATTTERECSSTIFITAENIRGRYWNIRIVSDKKLAEIKETNPEYFI
jgi:hypothetical protein